jgi:hypothetical protein
MSENRQPSQHTTGEASPRKRLSAAAERALQEAEQRRREHDAQVQSRPSEHGGQSGPEPTRYGDWEKGGIAKDF